MDANVMFGFYDNDKHKDHKKKNREKSRNERDGKSTNRVDRKISKSKYQLEEYIRNNMDLPEDWVPPIGITPVEKDGKIFYRVQIYIINDVKAIYGTSNKKVFRSYWVESCPDNQYIFTPPLREIPKKCLI